jgi:hypothetical protein
MARYDEGLAGIADQYTRFAEVEAAPTSPIYQALCLHVAKSDTLLRFLAELPKEKRQPNLFLAALRLVAGVPENTGALDEIIRCQGDSVQQVMVSHRTQTNEPARCAVLLPSLAQLPQPLALLEVGASAGLCLLPDYYAYEYGGSTVAPSTSGLVAAPVFPCAVNQETPVPKNNVEVVWRAGLDLNPLDIRSDQDADWLRVLVWPEHHERAARLNLALALAKNTPTKLRQGDLLNDLRALATSAPDAATLVIFHTAVLAYVSARRDRENFVSTVRDLDAVWISNEAPQVFPDLAKTAPSPPSPDMFLLAIDGEAVAWTAPHGQSIHWFGEVGQNRNT